MLVDAQLGVSERTNALDVGEFNTGISSKLGGL